MKYSPRNILKSELIRSTSILITGTVVAQLVSILLQPFLRRYFSADVFGTYAVYGSLVGIIAVIATLRFDDAIVLPGKDKDAANIIFLALIFNFIICLLFFLAVLFFGREILIFINISDKFNLSLLYLIPAGAFLLNLYQCFNYWLIRKKKYNIVSLNKLVRRGAEGVFQITFAFLKNQKGLIFSDLIGQFTNVCLIVYQSVRSGFRLNLISLAKIRYTAKKYSDFPRFSLLPSFMSTCSFLLPAILINKYYSAENAGYFDLSKLVLQLPLALVASSISNVLLQRVAEKFNKKLSFLDDLKQLSSVVILISLVEILVIIFTGTWLFRFAFGLEWGISAEISKILVWSFVLNFFVSSFSCIFISMRRIKLYSIWQFFYFVGIISLLLFRDRSFFEFLHIYMLVEVVCYITAILILAGVVLKYERSIKVA